MVAVVRPLHHWVVYPELLRVSARWAFATVSAKGMLTLVANRIHTVNEELVWSVHSCLPSATARSKQKGKSKGVLLVNHGSAAEILCLVVTC